MELEQVNDTTPVEHTGELNQTEQVKTDQVNWIRGYVMAMNEILDTSFDEVKDGND